MNHSPLVYLAAALALIAAPGCFRRAAESDFRWQLRVQHRGELAPGPAFERVRAECSANTARYRTRLQRKTLYSILWVATFALAAGWLVVCRVPGGFTHLNSQQFFSASSVLAFAWATLGRLGWAEGSYKGATVFEELDKLIFWLLYGAGTYCGVAAIANAT